MVAGCDGAAGGRDDSRSRRSVTHQASILRGTVPPFSEARRDLTPPTAWTRPAHRTSYFTRSFGSLNEKFQTETVRAAIN
jgi:hypothetical protein